ncbi:hypothetical protein CUC00_08450 [Prevotella intermedia]|uniref:hypothetical protein n=1 Tax=Prevotella intermedia TaxID=28131 RepID=UPI000C1C5203|nr:hypothetical protein [Prevotella intermedia]ATV32535.1 hypothetical protein CTM44_01485 [Prevotella intermedia]ATV41054.1 hypothetical protein CUC00_08450 [Prevotella intermedia]
MYNKRVWLNKESSPSTGNVVCFDGNTTWHGEVIRNTFLQLSDCNWSVRLHKTEDDNTTDFIGKLKLLRNEVDEFISYLEKNK